MRYMVINGDDVHLPRPPLRVEFDADDYLTAVLVVLFVGRGELGAMPADGNKRVPVHGPMGPTMTNFWLQDEFGAQEPLEAFAKSTLANAEAKARFIRALESFRACAMAPRVRVSDQERAVCNIAYAIAEQAKVQL